MLLAVVGTLVPAGAPVAAAVLAPVVSVEGGSAAVGPGAVLDVGGAGPPGAVVEGARVLGYEGDGGTVVQPFAAGSLGLGPQPSGEHLQVASDVLDGRVVLGCLFDAPPGSSVDAPRQCSPHDQVREVAVEVSVRVDGVLQTALSPRLPVDVVRPRVAGVEVLRPDELRVRFDEPVEAAGAERAGDWTVLHAGARYPVAAVASGEPADCGGVERRCARRLALSAPLPEDASPTVELLPAAPEGGYVDLAGNAHQPAHLPVRRHAATDRVRPPRPQLTAVDGVPVSGLRPRVASTRRRPVLTVTGAAAGHSVLVRATSAQGLTAESAPVLVTDPAVPVPVTAPLLQPGEAVLDVVVVDTAGNRSSAPLHAARPDLAPAVLDHVLDLVAPQAASAVVHDPRTVVVTLTEAVTGTDDPLDWYLLDGGVRTAVTAVAGGGRTRTLTTAADVAPTAVVHHAPQSEVRRQRDEAGHALPDLSLPAHGLAVPELPELETPAVVRPTTYPLTGTARSGTWVDAFADADGDRRPDGPALASAPASPAFTLFVPLVADAPNELLLVVRDPLTGATSPVLDVPTLVQDATPPSLVFPGPVAGSALPAGSVRPFGHTHTDANPGTVEAALSLDGGTTYAALPPVALDGGSVWAVPSTAADRAVLRLTAVDAAGRRTAVTSPVFAIDDAPPALLASTLDAQTVLVRLSETSVQGSSVPADWEVDHERAMAVTERLESGVLVARLTVRTPLARDARPQVTYLQTGGSAYRDRAGQQVLQPTVVATDGVLPPAPSVGVPAAAVLTTAQQVRVSGRATPLDVVELVDAWERTVARLPVAADGGWAADVPLVRDAALALRAQTRDPNGTRSGTATAVPRLDHDGTDPAVTVTEPLPGTVVKPGTRVTVRWTSADRNLLDGSTLVQVSLDGGRTYRALGSQLRATGSLVWTAPTAPTSEALLRVSTSDRAGRTGTGTSGPLGVGAAPLTASPTPSASRPSATPSAAPSATPSATPSASAAPSATPSRSATPSPTAGTPSARPVASATPVPPPPAPPAPEEPEEPEEPEAPGEPPRLSLSRTSSTPGVPTVATVTGEPGAAVELHAYSRPKTQFVRVRSGVVGDDGTVAWPVQPGTNTRLFARYAEGGGDSPSVVLEVRTALSLTVVRNGRRDYTFQGRLLPRRAAVLVTLYRVEASGRRVIVKQTRTDRSGTYRERRLFTGAGTFGFLSRTGRSLTNAPGESDEGRVRTVRIS